MMEWQPIETAPKDGTRILVYALGDAQVSVYRVHKNTGLAYWGPDDEQSIYTES